ncbi:MAG: hypothetical protein HC896_15130 [Bacteroidales bacterium]|nr:hypothetical protein [Bacteroidales bacterium]
MPSPNQLNATYLPDSTDKANGSLVLTLVSTNNGPCAVIEDNLTVSITPAPVVSAGENQNLTIYNPNVSLNGSVSAGAVAGKWSTTGTGVFTPNDSALNATYVPSEQDLATRSATLTLTCTNHGNCLPLQDNLLVAWSEGALVVSGQDMLVCESDPFVPLNGSVSIVTNTGIWSTDGTGTFDDLTDLQTNYRPSAAD